MSRNPQPLSLSRALSVAVEAARAAGALMRAHARSPKRIHLATQHDIKLELDVRSQKLIERRLRGAFPQVPILGEEGVSGDPQADARWVVDPIDGTVNFTYGIPHACVSIALERRAVKLKARSSKLRNSEYEAVVGVVYDPFCDELWTAVRGRPARLNGRRIGVSRRSRLEEAIVAMGFAKEKATLERMLPSFNALVHRVRKIRIMGAAALALTYVATGRMDAYFEYGLSRWDIAAGGLIVECAGGECWREPIAGEHKFRLLASNGRLREQIEAVVA